MQPNFYKLYSPEPLIEESIETICEYLIDNIERLNAA